MLTIINALDRRRFTPVLIMFTDRLDHAPPPDVPIVILSSRAPGGAARLVSRMAQLARLIRREQLDLVVSFLIGPNVVSIAGARLAGVPIVVGERSAPRTVLSHAHLGLFRSVFWNTLVRLTYGRATRIVTNSEGARAELIDLLRIPPERVEVIANGIDLARVAALAAEPLDDGFAWPADPVLVHVGRFSYAKDHATLLEAFATIRKHRRVKLMLIGDGEDEASVRARCTALGLDEDVIFTGFTRNPYRYLARAAVSVLTSRFEGLPNVLIESLALGVPVVSTACEFGPAEILGDDGAYGVLTPVGDPAAFAAAVEALLDDPARRRHLSELGPTRARDFDLRRIAPAYEDLLSRTAALRPARNSVAS